LLRNESCARCPHRRPRRTGARAGEVADPQQHAAHGGILLEVGHEGSVHLDLVAHQLAQVHHGGIAAEAVQRQPHTLLAQRQHGRGLLRGEARDGIDVLQFQRDVVRVDAGLDRCVHELAEIARAACWRARP
jgi:hypothetical protein